MNRSLPQRFREHYALVLTALATYWLLIFTLTHLPHDRLPGADLLSDKICHLLAYAGLTWLLALAVRLRRPLTLAGGALIVLLAVSYGGMDEWTQQFVRGRTMDVFDWVADLIGSILGVLALAGMAAAYRSLRCKAFGCRLRQADEGVV